MNHKRDNARLLCTNVPMIFCFSETQPTQKKSKKEHAKKKKILTHSLRQKKTDRDREQPFHQKKNKQTNVFFFCRCFFSADDGSRRDDENYNRFTFKRTRRRR